MKKSSDDHLPEGLAYTPLWISQTEQDSLLELIDSSTWSVDLGRRTQHYGRRYSYSSGRVEGPKSAPPLPQILCDLAARLYDERVMKQVPDQVIVNEYVVDEGKTQGIGAHVDHVRDFGPVIVTLSLLEAWSMRFTREGHKYVDHLLEPGSIAVLAGASRYEWQHSIPPRKFEREGGFQTPRQRRVSVTFRTIGGGL
jgi:alkylated DNA repair dioxygenase AlkB